MSEYRGVPPMRPPPVLQPAPPPMPYVPPPRGPIWHKVIGIISICLAGLHLLCGLLGMVAGAAFQSMMRGFPTVRFPRPRPTTGPASRPVPGPDDFPFEDFDPFEMLQIPDWVYQAQMVLQIASLVAAGVLLWAGISLLQRRRRGWSLHLGYGILRTIVVLATVAVTVAFMTSIMSRGAPRFFGSMLKAQLAASVVMQILLGLAYPMFLLIWLSRRKVRAQVDEWDRPDPAEGPTPT